MAEDVHHHCWTASYCDCMSTISLVVLIFANLCLDHTDCLWCEHCLNACMACANFKQQHSTSQRSTLPVSLPNPMNNVYLPTKLGINVTSTSVYNTTLTPSTVYTPASTAKQTKTVTPKPVTTTTTSVTTYTKTAHAYTIVKSTKTITAPCTSLTWKPVVDPICTIKPTITNIDSLINSLVTALPILPREQQREAARIPDKMIARNWVRLGRRAPGEFRTLITI